MFYRFIASELTNGTLKDVIKGNYKGPPIGHESRSVLLQIIEGLSHLHDKNIVHRNLKPSTIRISIPEGRIGPLLKLADFGLSARFINKRKSSAMWEIIGSLSWLPAEIYHTTKFTFAMDIFALGCIFAYFLSGGIHPYGTVKEERLNHIKRKDTVTLTAEELINATGAYRLIRSMLSSDPEQRPSCLNVSSDCFFQSEITKEPFPVKIKEEPMDDEVIFVEHFHASNSQQNSHTDFIKDPTASTCLSSNESPEKLMGLEEKQPIASLANSSPELKESTQTSLTCVDKVESESCKEQR